MSQTGQDRQTDYAIRQRSDSIGRTVLQTVTQKPTKVCKSNQADIIFPSTGHNCCEQNTKVCYNIKKLQTGSTDI